ncbi:MULTISPECIES: SRPBCC family protein [unclassified Gordonia (in: high G+C Gram-positive bacteria)]
MKWRELNIVGDPFFASAPVCTTVTLDIDATPEQVWEVLAADDAVVSWSPLVTAASWAGERGVGAVRTVTIAKALSVQERFYRWDENSRMTFAATRTTGPGIKAFAEDYVLTEQVGSTRLDWTVAIDVPAPLRAAGRPVSAGLGAAVRQLAKGLHHKVVG